MLTMDGQDRRKPQRAASQNESGYAGKSGLEPRPREYALYVMFMA
jgi:hypothetical protein